MNQSKKQLNSEAPVPATLCVPLPLLFILLSLGICCTMQNTHAAQINENDPIIEFELARHQKLLNHLHGEQVPLTPFVTDGCSGGLSVGWNYLAEKIPQFSSIHGSKPPWEQCCVTHDRVYHKGAVAEESKYDSFSRRLDADRELKNCVIKTGKNRTAELINVYDVTEKELTLLYQATSELMYRAVRAGGIPCSGLPWRWGFGQPECK